jgi:hypothetical protein
MSIPDKFGRIVKHKLGELKDWFDQVDEERDAREEAEQRRKRGRTDARRELEDALGAPLPPTAPRGDRAAAPPASLPRRTPEEIARGQQSGGAAPAAAGGAAVVDALDYHYRLLGLEPGADFAAVQAAYNKLAARSDPSRFAAGSQDESLAREIRKRLDVSYQALRDVLDMTARRFDLLEFDAPAAPPAVDAAGEKGAGREPSRASNLEI